MEHHLSLYKIFYTVANTGQPLDDRQQTGTAQVAQPDNEKKEEVGRLVFLLQQVTGLTGEQIIAPGTDGHEANGEEKGASHVAAGKGVFQAQEDGAAQGDADASEQGREKGGDAGAFRHVITPEILRDALAD